MIFVTMGVHGLGMGLLMSLYTLVIIDYMGLKLYPATFGSACLFKGTASIVIGPLAGNL